MKFKLNAQEIQLLSDKGIPFNADHEYTEDEALDLLDQLREIEVSYAQFTGGTEQNLFFLYGNLADKIHSMIPEE